MQGPEFDLLAMIVRTKVKIRNAIINRNCEFLAQCTLCNDVQIFVLLSVSMVLF